MKINLDKIAKEISLLEDMPNDERYRESCILVAENVYKLDYDNAYEVSEIIQKKYLYPI